MAVKVFVMGLPGSGKSTATSCSAMEARDKKCRVQCFNDYDILLKWFKANPDGPDFSRTDAGGFDIHNYAVFDTSLHVLEQQVQQAIQAMMPSDKEIVTIEFARSDYRNALLQFSASFLCDAYFLFIDAEVETCKERVKQRASEQSSNDDHPVSDYIFEAYYRNGREYCTASDINAFHDKSNVPYDIQSQRIRIVKNVKGNTLQDFYTEIKRLTGMIIEQQDITAEALENAELAEANECVSISAYEATNTSKV